MNCCVPIPQPQHPPPASLTHLQPSVPALLLSKPRRCVVLSVNTAVWLLREKVSLKP